MCGIVGFVGAGGTEALRRMTDALEHRGPDGSGYFLDRERSVHLGHRRLSIIDVAHGAQPMFNEDKSIVIVFNGEIYNHVELREALSRRGHYFATDHSDTEVLIHGYEEWGQELLPRLNGMFALAIYDQNRQVLFLARDRFGEKPLYYWQRGDIFGFASEMGALRRHPKFDEAVEAKSLQKYFAYGFIPSPHSLWTNCSKLPGGHFLRYDLRAGTSSTGAYWSFKLEPDPTFERRDERSIIEELQGLLANSVRRRLVSDVPLGVFLSGGIDSSAALALASRARGSDPIDSFTIGFEEPSYDESVFARRMASFVGARYHAETLSMQRMRDLFPVALDALDEPISDPSIVPTYMLAQFARRHVTVALSGDGGDELFAGYDPFKALKLASIYSYVMPPVAHRLVRNVAGHLPMSTANMSFDFKLRRTLTGLSYDRRLWNPIWLCPVEPRDLPDLLDRPIDPDELFSDAISLWNEDPTLSLQEQTLKFYTKYYLQDNILVKSDRATMANSLESRAIFLDNDLVAFCERLPYRFKFRNGRGKYILRESLRGVVPPDLLARRKKGFGIPVGQWLCELPPSPPMRPIGGINLQWVSDRWREHRSGSADHRLFLWSWLSAQSAQSEHAPTREAA